jgi:outer membrane protein OmpA-like peptidoglycan-associated protein
MNRKLVTIAIAASLLSATGHYAHADDADTRSGRHKQYIGTGIGATAGAIIAGPVGFVAGGVIGNLAGRHDAMEENTRQPPADSIPLAEASTYHTAAMTPEGKTGTITAGYYSDDDSSIDDVTDTEEPNLLDVVLPAARLEIFFLSGSTEVESFYKPRIEAITKLLHAVPDIDVILEGYSDRRGDKAGNLQLSSVRVESVLKQLTEAGIDADRIDIRALGEENFVSSPGDLEAYTFDRRVVIRLDQAPLNPASPVAMTADEQGN